MAFITPISLVSSRTSVFIVFATMNRPEPAATAARMVNNDRKLSKSSLPGHSPGPHAAAVFQ